MAGSEENIELVEDMVNMVVLDEVSVLNNLRDRFKRDDIYTNVGAILISVNPYRNIPKLYSKQSLSNYQQNNTLSSPHIYKVTEAAYRRMLDYEADQSILISGESGAGKTEACKCILQYLAEVSGQSGQIQDQILESNPLMEAFGNAKTVRNNNSSRFGKFIQLKFSRSGQLVGADITKYLLEKSRVVYQAPQERNYHIFYELCAGLSGPLRSTLHIGQADEYRYLNQGKTMTIEGVSDSAQFEITKKAMKTIGIADDKQKEIFQVLAAILHIGNINFEFIKETDSVIVKNEKEVDIAAKLLGIKSSTLNFALCHRDIIVSGQTFKKPLDLKQAVDSRDALAKGLYDRIFDWLVERINKSISSQDTWHTIGVLDIFGFEFFDNNSLEQLCINYCNEKLQLMYNTHVFQQEQREYTQEGINCDQVEFVDNQPCIDFFEKSLGIISILDEECRFPQATDRTFLEKLEANHKTTSVFGKELRSNSRFVVRHFAGEVSYDVAGFMDKNRDTLRNELAVLVKKSELSFVKLLFGDKPVPEATSSPTMGRAGSSSGAPSSVCSQFKYQLGTLMKTLATTSPHFIRCVKPNVLKLPDIFDEKLVSAQLRYTGVLGTIKIRQAGFPVRFPFAEFIHRYRVLLPIKEKKNTHSSKREEAAALAKVLPIGNYQVGKSKIFFKSPRAFDELENQRKLHLGRAASKIQSLYRGRKQFVKFQKILLSALVFQNAVRSAIATRQLLRYKEERNRRLREEQIQKEKEQKQRDEQLRLEREQKQKEREEKEREAKELRARQEEMARNSLSKRHKFKYKYCTCGKAREDEKENTNPNKDHAIQALKDLLDKYGASSIGNVYEDGRTINVELFLYKYEFLNKDHVPKPAPLPSVSSSLLPKKVGPAYSVPKPPVAPIKSLAKPYKPPAKTTTIVHSNSNNNNNGNIGRGTTGVSSGILSKISQFQSKPSEPSDSLVSPRRFSPLNSSNSNSNSNSNHSSSGPSPRSNNSSNSGTPRNSSSSIPSSKSSPSVPSTKSSTSISIPSSTSVSSIPTSPHASVSAVYSASTVTSISIGSSPPATNSISVSSLSSSANKPPLPPAMPNVVVLPKPPSRVLVPPPSSSKPAVVVVEEEEEDDRVLTFKEIRERMAKKLPNILTSLASTLIEQQDNVNEYGEVTSTAQLDTWEQYKSKVQPTQSTEMQLLGSLTKERAKPPSRRARSKPQKSEAPSVPSTARAPSPAITSSPPVSSSLQAPRVTAAPSTSSRASSPSIPSSSSTAPLLPSSPSKSTLLKPTRPTSTPVASPPVSTSSKSSPSPSVPISTLPPKPRPISTPAVAPSPSSASSDLSSVSTSPSSSPTPAKRPASKSQIQVSSTRGVSSIAAQFQQTSAQQTSPRPAPRPHSQPPGFTRPSPSMSVISSKSSRKYVGPSLEPGLAPKNVMGVDPATLNYTTDMGYKVPDFLVSLKVLFLKHKGPEKEGIFRVSGREDIITKLGQDISEGVIQLECEDVLSTAGFLKRWYSRLPQKLLQQLDNTDIESLYSSPGKAKIVLKSKLSDVYYGLFWWLIALLCEVTKKQEINKMGPKNIATLLGPIVRDIGPEIADLQKNQKITSILQHILEYNLSGS